VLVGHTHDTRVEQAASSYPLFSGTHKSPSRLQWKSLVPVLTKLSVFGRHKEYEAKADVDFWLVYKLD